MLIIPITSYLIAMVLLSVVQSFLYPFDRDGLALLGAYGTMALLPMVGLLFYFGGYSGWFHVVAVICLLCWVLATYFSSVLSVQWLSGRLEFSQIGKKMFPIVEVSILVAPLILAYLFRLESSGLFDFVLLASCFSGYSILLGLLLFVYEFGRHFTN